MKTRDFCYWMQGFFDFKEVSQGKDRVTLTGAQIDCIRKHLNMVFVHEIDPSFGDKKHQEELTKTHEGIPRATSSKQALGTLTITGVSETQSSVNC